MCKHNRFLILLICVSLAFLVSCMNEKKEAEAITEKQQIDDISTEIVLTESIVTESTSLTDAELPITTEATALLTKESPKTEAPVTYASSAPVTTALPLPQTRTESVTSIPETPIIPVTTAKEAETSTPSHNYDDEILIDIMYETDEEGKWSGIGKYIANTELLGDAEEFVIMRSKMAYDEVYSILSGEDTERTLADAYNAFRNGIKVILLNKGIDFTEVDAVGYEILKLK